MRVMAAKDGVLVRRRLRIFAAAVALVLLCAVCVGGVSGYEFTASTEQELRDAVEKANNELDYPGADIISITENIARTTNTPITITSKITFINAENKDVTITAVNQLSIRSMFVVDGGELILSADASGSLKINGGGHIISEPGGGGIYVTNDGALVMNEGVTITNFGWLGGATGDWTGVSYDGAGIYVADGFFTMNGGTISKCNARHGGAVYISSTGSCTINDGLITLNGHKYTLGPIILSQSEGGAVYVADDGTYVQKKEESDIYKNNDGNPANVRYFATVTTITYTVEHYLQNLDLRTYTLSNTERVKGTVGHDTTADVGNYPGFTAEDFSQEKIESENTVVKIYYNRDTTTIIWIVDEVQFYEYSGIYGSAVTHPSSLPTKAGYHFSGWNPAVPSTMPAEDLTVEAMWTAGLTYNIIIPESITLVNSEEESAGSMTITATQIWIPTEDSLLLTIHSQNEFELVLSDFESYSVPYTLTVTGSSEPLSNIKNEVATFTMAEYQQQGSGELSVILDAKLPSAPKYAGEYLDLLTFTVTYIGDGIITA